MKHLSWPRRNLVGRKGGKKFRDEGYMQTEHRDTLYFKKSMDSEEIQGLEKISMYHESLKSGHVRSKVSVRCSSRKVVICR